MPEVAYEILFAETVQEFMIGLSDRVYNRVRDFVRLIATNPEMGRDYLPEYEAPSPPMPSKRIVVPRTSVELYYFIDYDRKAIVMAFACDARSDPRLKFWHAYEH